MVNRKIAMSGMSILAAVTLLGGSAFAAFTTTATAQNNTFSATTLSLQLQVDNGGFGNPVPGITVGGLVPGGTPVVHNFDVKNTNSDTAQSITLNFNNNPASTLPGTDTTVVVDCGQGSVSDSYSGWMTGHFIGNVSANTTMNCTMSVSLNSGVPNSDQGLSDYFDAVFTGSAGS